MKDFSRSGDKDKLKQRQEEDIKLVKKYVGMFSKPGLELKEFQTDDNYEFYFDVFRELNLLSICYISRGWDEPAYKIGESINISKDILESKEKFYKILDICSDNLVSIKVSPLKDNNVQLDLQIGIYPDGFNEKVLRKALDSLEDSLRKVRQLLEP